MKRPAITRLVQTWLALEVALVMLCRISDGRLEVWRIELQRIQEGVQAISSRDIVNGAISCI